MQKKSLHGYTLVEIVVVVSLLAFLVVFGSNLNFSRLTQKQETSIETQKIKSMLEEIRNAAFFGRSVGQSGIIPGAWSIDISKIGSGSIATSYLSGSWLNSGKNWSAQIPYEISNLSCARLGNTNTGNIIGNNTGSLVFTGSDISLLGCSDSNHKILTLELKNRDYSEFLELNTVTGVIRTY